MFGVRYTNTYSIRATGRLRDMHSEFKRVNHAIRKLKEQQWPSVISFRDPKYKRMRTLMAWEGMDGNFARHATRGVVRLARLLYIPKGLLRITSRRRKTRK